MKKAFCLALGALVALLLLSPRPLSAADRPYTEGSVWELTMVRVNTGYGEEYLQNLANVWRKVHDEAVKDGLILSYKVIECDAANSDDWHLLLMVEFKNYAALDTAREKWAAYEAKVVGDQAAQLKGYDVRATMREFYGTKMGRELKFK